MPGRGEDLRDAERRAIGCKKRGVDVVIGYVEPHDRPETSAQIGDLEVVSPRSLNYHGISLKEMDVDAVIARKPTVALVDELAHTNAPDSKNRKRYEDMEDLLRAGINVISTVNIQHLESLYNFVEECTGVRVKERVPDEIVAKADQIVNIDLPAEDLQERLQAGKIYPKERIEAAMANFFTQKNLTRLRELTLTETANFLDRQQRERRERVECERARSGFGRDQQSRPRSGTTVAQNRAARLTAQRAMVRCLCSHARGIGRPHRCRRPNAASPTRSKPRRKWAV